jgi:hypothetical protein
MASVVSGSQYTINATVQRKESWSPHSWMRDLAPLIGERPIHQIAIPGTHDSAPWPDKQNLADLRPAMKNNLNRRSSTQSQARYNHVQIKLHPPFAIGLATGLSAWEPPTSPRW